MQIRSAALSDRGKVRRNNEDRLVCNDTLRLYAVADGIGGLPNGDEAAQLAVTELEAAISARPDDSLPSLTRLTLTINAAVCDLADRRSPLGMGTTLTYGLIRNDTLHLVHVGDSRCYLLRAGKLSLLTNDHTVENDVRRRRAAGEFVIFDEAQRKSLTRCIGQRIPLEVDVSEVPLQLGDRILFCSDGIDKVIESPVLDEIMARNVEPKKILTALIDLANVEGGIDNATGVLLFVE